MTHAARRRCGKLWTGVPGFPVAGICLSLRKDFTKELASGRDGSAAAGLTAP
jgi:hypothetical protein